jgi:hypothetical protein
MKRTRKGVFAPRRIASVAAGDLEGRVAVAWEDGGVTAIDLTPWIRSGELVQLLDPAYFASATVGEHGWTIAWGGEEIEIDSVHLQMLEAEQHGVVYSPDALRRWRERHGLTLEAAAKALGLSRRMVAYYEAGEERIPKSVALACKGYAALSAERQRPAA